MQNLFSQSSDQQPFFSFTDGFFFDQSTIDGLFQSRQFDPSEANMRDNLVSRGFFEGAALISSGYEHQFSDKIYCNFFQSSPNLLPPK